MHSCRCVGLARRRVYDGHPEKFGCGQTLNLPLVVRAGASVPGAEAVHADLLLCERPAVQQPAPAPGVLLLQQWRVRQGGAG
jgi:hypothetical protein